MAFNFLIKPLIRQAFNEDLANGGDITTESLVSPDKKAKAVIRAREAGVLSGIKVTETIFNSLDSSLVLKRHLNSGDKVKEAQIILEIEGSAASILTAERTALNFLTHLSGIATLTKAYVDQVAHTNAKITCTRKTIPGLRALEKYAVSAGGGYNHRFGLGDAFLIKDNHIALAGGIRPALDKVLERKNHMLKVEIEVDTLDQLSVVLGHGGADIVLLDNMDVPTLARAVKMCKGHVLTEASGGVRLENVKSIAETGVDFISVGALTHSAPALDIGLDIDT